MSQWMTVIIYCYFWRWWHNMDISRTRLSNVDGLLYNTRTCGLLNCISSCTLYNSASVNVNRNRLRVSSLFPKYYRTLRLYNPRYHCNWSSLNLWHDPRSNGIMVMLINYNIYWLNISYNLGHILRRGKAHDHIIFWRCNSSTWNSNWLTIGVISIWTGFTSVECYFSSCYWRNRLLSLINS